MAQSILFPPLEIFGSPNGGNKVQVPNTNSKAHIIFTALHLKDKKMEFFPYDFDFDDSFKTEWNSQEAFGRMDPMMVYKRTTRDATLTFNVVAENTDSPGAVGSAQYNFQQLQNFLQCLYPTYEGVEETIINSNTPPPPVNKAASDMTNPTTNTTQAEYGAQVIKASPLFTVSFMNLLNNNDYIVAITNFKHKFKFDSGATSLSSDGKMIPGEFNLSISLKILHTKLPSIIKNY